MLPAGETAHFVWDISAALIITVLLGNALLCHVFSKTWAKWLGLLSFPIYLLHVPIMLSAGATSIMNAAGPFGTTGAVLLAAAVTAALTLAFALPLAWVDKAWTGVLGRVAGVLMKKRGWVEPPAFAGAGSGETSSAENSAGNCFGSPQPVTRVGSRASKEL